MNQLNKIYQGDCIELMKQLDNNSVDMILSDLPYNITSAAYDKNIIDLQEYWKEARRILKPCCSAVMFASSKFAIQLINTNFDQYKYRWTWIKNAPTFFIHAKNAPMHISEDILIFSDGVINHETVSNRRMKYFPQGLKDGGRFYKGRKAGQVYNNHNDSLAHQYQAKQSNYPKDVLYFGAPFNVHKLHPSQKPVDLCEYLIKTYTQTGEIVLDTCIGSGTTAVAAINTGRNFIGFELDEKYFAVAEKRIEMAFAEREQKLFDFMEE